MLNKMYVSYANDCPQKKYGDGRLLAVYLDQDIMSKIDLIRDPCCHAPWPVTHHYRFPVKNVRIIEEGYLDDYVTDCKVYQDWERGGDDPLEYYRYQIHPYEPKEDWFIDDKIDWATLIHGEGNDFGFSAVRNGVVYEGYIFNWSRYL